MAKAKNSKAKYPVTHIRDWREFRGLTLQQVEQRMEKAPGETLISSVSIGRIERGEQPYSQPILEALAVALNCTTADLLTVNPKKDGVVIDLLQFIRQADRSRLEQLAKIARAIA